MFDFTEIKVIGFDLDQTLYEKSHEVDAEIQSYIYEKISTQKKCSLEEAELLFSGLYKNGRGLSGSKTLETLGVPNAGEVVQEALEFANIASVLVPNKATISLLKNIKETYKNIDLLTGSNDSNASIKLAKLNIGKEIFGTIFTADNASKSDGSMYKLWLDTYDFPAEKFLYIGDRPMSDYEIPKKYGIKSILVNVKEQDPSIDCLQLKNLSDLNQYLL